MKILIVQEYPQPGILDKWFEKAAKIAGLEWGELGHVVIADRPLGELYGEREEPVYTKTGKVSKKGKKVRFKTVEFLYRESELRQRLTGDCPNLIVAAGDAVFEMLTELRGVYNYRGSVVSGRAGFKVLAVEPPKHGDTLGFWVLVRDLQKARREGEFGEIHRTPFESYHDPDHRLEETLTLIEMIGNYSGEPWSLDVETRAGTLACFGIAQRQEGSMVGFCVPIQTTTGPYWTLEEEWRIWEMLKWSAGRNRKLVNQNIEYDIYYLLRYGVEPSGVWMDTMLAHSVLYPELPKSLDFLASWYLDNVVYWKSDHRDWTGRTPDEALWEYNVKDAVYTLRIAGEIDGELKRRGLWDFYHG